VPVFFSFVIALHPGRSASGFLVWDFKLTPIVKVRPSNKPSLSPIQSPAHRTPPLAVRWYRLSVASASSRSLCHGFFSTTRWGLRPSARCLASGLIDPCPATGESEQAALEKEEEPVSIPVETGLEPAVISKSAGFTPVSPFLLASGHSHTTWRERQHTRVRGGGSRAAASWVVSLGCYFSLRWVAGSAGTAESPPASNTTPPFRTSRTSRSASR
jgi:hypothetical protein